MTTNNWKTCSTCFSNEMSNINLFYKTNGSQNCHRKVGFKSCLVCHMTVPHSQIVWTIVPDRWPNWSFLTSFQGSFITLIYNVNGSLAVGPDYVHTTLEKWVWIWTADMRNIWAALCNYSVSSLKILFRIQNNIQCMKIYLSFKTYKMSFQYKTFDW